MNEEKVSVPSDHPRGIVFPSFLRPLKHTLRKGYVVLLVPPSLRLVSLRLTLGLLSKAPIPCPRPGSRSVDERLGGVYRRLLYRV